MTDSGRAGKHWSAEKVANVFAPHPETKDTVMDWLVESGIDRSRLSLSAGKYAPTNRLSRAYGH